MIKFITSFFTIIISLSVWSQAEVKPQFSDDELYIGLTKESASKIIGSEGKIKTEAFFEVFSEIITDKQINQIEAPFFAAVGFELQWVLRVSFVDNKDMDKWAVVFNEHMATIYAERIPLLYLDFTPNDLGANSSNNQWHLYKIQAREAWDISKGSKVVKVAIVDDAVQINHPDLINNIWVNTKEIPNNGIDDDKNGYIDDINGYDVGGLDNDPSPNNNNFSHGTHCAGISGSTTNNAVGIASIGFNITIIPVKCTTTGQTNTQLIPRGYEGITYAASAGADIISCSWGGSTSSVTGSQVIQFAISKGAIVLAAMGNDNRETKQYPASYSGVISVAATNINDGRSSYSNYDVTTTISAPGDAIRSTVAGSTYASQSGTSMATPLVSGTLALMKSHMPGITNGQLTGCLLSSATNINAQNPNFIGKLGAGRVNAFKALQCVDSIKNASAPDIVFSQGKTAFCPGETVRFSAGSSKGVISSYYWEFPGGSPSFSSDPEPEVTYTGTGTRSYYLTVSNQNGIDKDSVKNGLSFSDQGTSDVVFSNFQSGIANSVWQVQNANGTYGWQQVNIINSGDTNRVMKLNGFGATSNNIVSSLVSQELNFSDFGNVRLTFDFAYARRSATATDSLFVELSTDQGATFKQLYAEGLSSVLFVSGTQTTAFTPSNVFQWCSAQGKCLNIDLKSYNRAPSIVLRIRHLGAGSNGNNLYIDNIHVVGNCAGQNAMAPVAATTTANTSACGPVSVLFNDNSSNFPEQFRWYFPGGTPSTSTNPSELVSYSGVGSYDVILAVENQYGVDSVLWPNKVVIRNLPTISVIANDTLFCRGKSTTLTADGGFTYTWSPVTAISSTSGKVITATPTASIVYTVEGTDNFGCKNSAAVAIQVLEAPLAPLIFRSGYNLYIASQTNVDYQWYRNGVLIPGAESFEHTALLSGDYEVLLTHKNSGCTTWSREKSNVTFTTIAGVENQLFSLYPNPSSGQITLVAELPIGVYRVFGVDGKMVLTGNCEQEQMNLNVQNLNPGIYTIEWGNAMRARFAVQK